VLDATTRPLARVAPPEAGSFIADLHRRNGVDLQLNCPVSAIDTAKSSCIVVTTDGRTIEADLIVIGVGAVPNTELAEAASLVTDDGILVDEFGRTSDPGIFAAGDVTRHFNPLLGRAIRLETSLNAQNQAAAVAKIVAGGSDAYAEIPWLWTDQFDTNIQVAGAPTEWDQVVYRGEPTDRSFMIFQLLHRKVVGSIGVNAWRDMRLARYLIASRSIVDGDMLANIKFDLRDLCR
jgi:3-phenylpropionate/trans-cinnamate dioxygenase ferredoxin reductase subunit